MMNKISRLYFFLLILCFSPNLQGQINGNKQIKTLTYEFSSFSGVVIQTPATVTIEVGASVSNVAITTDENIFAYLPVIQSGTQIRIDPKTWIEPSELKIVIKTPSLEALRTGGYGNYRINNLSGSSFVLDNPVGTVAINGQVNEFIFSTSTGKIIAQKLNTRTVKARIESFGIAQVNAPGLLDALLIENGTITYEKEPEEIRKLIEDDGQILSAIEYQEELSERRSLKKIHFKLRNNSRERIHAYVRGPKSHRFSYGFSLNAQQKRAEEWPVGTKVFQVNKTGMRKLLVTVEANNEGNIVDLFD